VSVSETSWWDLDKDKAHDRIIEHVGEVERTHSFLFDRFYKLDCLYDPYHDRIGGHNLFDGLGESSAVVNENVIASNVDTVAAIVAATEVRARLVTDGAPWSVQRKARQLALYAEGLDKLLELHAHAARAFKAGALKGTGLVKVWADHDAGEICVEDVPVDDIVVDEGECRSGKPRQIHQRMLVDRDSLKARFPDHEHEIDRAQTTGDATGAWRYWADYRPIESGQVVVVESWRLPIGKKGSKFFKPGRHVICVDGATLFDEEYEKDFFPFARFVWSERNGWYGIGLAERISGNQRQINKMNWQVDRQLDRLAVPITYVRQTDAHLSVSTVNRAGAIAPVFGDMPVTVIPPAVSGEVYARLDRLSEKSYQESGVSRLAATASKPGGIESGAALREYRDATTQRFAGQEKRFEQLKLDMVWLALDAAKDLGEAAPAVVRRALRGARKIKWADVDMEETRIQLAAASNLSRTPAGRMQAIIEQSQAGLISSDEARRQLRPMSPLDLESEMAVYVSELEDIEFTIEEILDGEDLVPEPFQSLELGVVRVKKAVRAAMMEGAPEDRLEALREWAEQAADMLNPPAPPAPAPMPGAEMGMDPMAPPMDPAAGPMPMPAAPGQPTAALAPEAMSLIAS
jgi:hypothetical protein